jgi:predicted 2-oxoglutarate/Fe(II)-dependent dioxygenase YbiX
MIHLTNKLNKDECAALINWFNLQRKMKINSTHESVMFTIEDVHEQYIKNLIIERVKEVNSGYELSWMTFARIGDGGNLVQHKDMVPTGAEMAKRILTAVFYLSDEFTGGELISENHEPIKPVLGSVVVFDGCNITHGVETVKNGDRFTLSTWSI